MKRIIPFFILIILGVVIGCKPNQTNPESHLADSLREDSITLKIGYLPTLESLPFLAAEKLGYFKDSKIKLLRFDAGMDLDTAILNNRVQCITSDLCRAILLNKTNPNIKIISRTQGGYQLITAKNQRIRKVKDLKERLIAIARNEISDCLLDKLLEHEQIGTDVVNRPQINSLPLRKQMMFFEELDAAMLPEPFATECLLNGDHSIASNKDIDTELGCILVNKQASSEFLDQMNVVAHAYNEAVKYLQKNKVNLANYYDITSEIADTLDFPSYEPLTLPREKDIETSIKWLKSRDLVPGQLRIDHILEERYINK